VARYQRTLAARYPRLNWRQPEPLRPEQLPLDEQTVLIEYAVAPDWLTIVWARRQGGRTRLGGHVVRVPMETLRAEIQALLQADRIGGVAADGAGAARSAVRAGSSARWRRSCRACGA
jgi:hypothetical protein